MKMGKKIFGVLFIAMTAIVFMTIILAKGDTLETMEFNLRGV